MTARELIIDQYKIILDRKFAKMKKWSESGEHAEKLAKERRETNRLLTAVKRNSILPGLKTKFASVLDEEVKEHVNSMYYVNNKRRYEAIYFTVDSGEYAYMYNVNVLNSASFPYGKLRDEFMKKGMVHINYGDSEFIRYSTRGFVRRLTEGVTYCNFTEVTQNGQDALNTFNAVIQRAKDDNARILVLDGVLDLCGSKLPWAPVKDFLRRKPYGLELLMTGRDAPTHIVPYADYLSNAVRQKAVTCTQKSAAIRAWCGDITLRETAVHELYAQAHTQRRKTARVHFLGGGWPKEQDASGITVLNATGTAKFTFQMTKADSDYASEQTIAAFDKILRLSESEGIDFLLLDDVFDSCELNLLPLEMLESFLRRKPLGLEVVVTGYRMPEEVGRLATDICFTENKRHPHNSVIARQTGVGC